jgi:hypothetical protein
MIISEPLEHFSVMNTQNDGKFKPESCMACKITWLKPAGFLFVGHFKKFVFIGFVNNTLIYHGV